MLFLTSRPYRRGAKDTDKPVAALRGLVRQDVAPTGPTAADWEACRAGLVVDAFAKPENARRAAIKVENRMYERQPIGMATRAVNLVGIDRGRRSRGVALIGA